MIHVKREEAEKQVIAQKRLSCDFPKLIEESILNKDLVDNIGRYWYEDIVKSFKILNIYIMILVI